LEFNNDPEAAEVHRTLVSSLADLFPSKVSTSERDPLLLPLGLLFEPVFENAFENEFLNHPDLFGPLLFLEELSSPDCSESRESLES
jgi:hypothetical protein